MRWPFGGQRPVLTSLRTRLGKSAVIYPAATLNSIGLGIANLALVYFLRYRFGASSSVIGLIASAHSISYFAGCFVLRPLARSLLPRYSLILSSGLNGLFVILVLMSPSTGLAALWIGMSGLSLSLFWPPMMGWISAGLEGQKLNTALSRFNLSWSTGVVISPFIAGYLTESSRELPFAVSAALYFSVCLLVVTASIALHNVKADRHLEPKKTRKGGDIETGTPLRYLSWVGVISTYSVIGILNVVLPIYGREVMGIAERAVGLILLTRGVATTFGFYVIGKSAWWHFKTMPILGTQILFALCVVLLANAGKPVAYYLTVPFIGFLAAFTYSSSVFHGVSGTKERAKRMAIHEALLVAGLILGSSAGGFIYQRYSMSAVYYSALVLTLSAFAAQLVLAAVFKRHGYRSNAAAD
ncbi:MAG: MFS transporter [Spirochaetales bacterium]|jgi:predicted MFS family arabinose efflux permease|nr:MFS transporter [Spirochaetales bacterium]